MLHNTLIEILTTEMGVTVCGNDLKDTVVDRQQAHIEGAASQVVDQDVLLSLLVQSVGNGGRSRLVDDAENIQASNHTGILCGLTLLIVEVGWHSYHGVLHVF